MQILLIRYYIRNTRGSGSDQILSGHYIETLWDDVANTFVVNEYDNASDTTPTVRTSGPDLGFVSLRGRTRPPADADVVNPVGGVITYSFCNGTTLESFVWKSYFPYAAKVSTPNSFQCVSMVCDLAIDEYSTTPATDIETADGTITISASTSHGPAKYSITGDFDYSTAGQISGIFTGLYPGTYTITVKDALNCTGQIVITVGVPTNYSVKYRLQPPDGKARVDILERGYTGSIIDVKGTDDPFILDQSDNGTNKFVPLIPSSAEINLISESNFYFKELFTQDDRKFQVLYYLDSGSGLELQWVGYIISQNYKEAYLPPPYAITITATDGLADLKTFAFTDKDENGFTGDINTLSAIIEVLKKTNLDINIQCGINKFEDDMLTTDTDDPLKQCTFDADTFNNDGGSAMDCATVITEILKPFGAVIRQRKAKWYIYCSEQSVSSVPYREFNLLGEFVSNGVHDNAVDITVPILENRASFRDSVQVLEVIPSYGKFSLQYNLQKVPSLVKSYSFEEKDVYIDTSGIVLLRNWNVNIANDPGATFGIKQTKAFEGNYNFYYKKGTTSLPNNTGNVVLTSVIGQIEYESDDDFEYSFSYSAILGTSPNGVKSPLWVRLKWMLKIGNLYYNDLTGQWTSDAANKYNTIYISAFNQTDNFKIVADLPSVTGLTLEDFQIEFVFERENRVDFFNAETTTNLKAIPTVNLPIDSKVKGQGNGSLASGRYRYYKLVEDTGDVTGAIVPNDHDSDDNAKVWVEEGTTGTRIERTVEYIYIDNVVLKNYPNGTEPPESITTESVNNKLLKINFEDEFMLNDIDTELINNSERTYRNYFKLLDGTPTQLWTRTYRAGEGKLLDLLANEYKTQYKKGSNKITGNFDIDRIIYPSDCLREVNDGNRRYIFIGYKLHAFRNMLEFDIAEMVDVTESTSPDIGAGYSTGFSLGFNS